MIASPQEMSLGDVDVDRLSRPPRVRLGNWPTPIQRLVRDGAPDVLVKRDDLCGHGRGGAKARKIEHIVDHLLENGHGELITVAGNVTNLVFDLLPVLHAQGIRPRLFILDDPPTLPRDRERIFEGVREHVVLVGANRCQTLRAVTAAFVRSRAAGRAPFIAFPGVSHPSAVVGNAKGFIEMVRQREEASEPLPSTVFVTAATGTTLAGFLLGEHAMRRTGRRPIRIVGVQVYPSAIRRLTLGLIRWTERTLRIRDRVPADRIEVASSALGGGFGHYSETVASLCERVEAESHFRIDPIFGGKTWSFMEQHLEASTKREPALYWHCGYTPEWRTLGTLTARSAP